MGYTTDFTGHVTIEPPLNEAEVAYINKFGRTRRMNREKGPYFVDGSDGGWGSGQGHDDDIIDYNRPPAGQPGLWMQWVASEDGTTIEWDGNEKFYNSVEWMTYLLDHFIRPGAMASKVNDPQFADFTFDHNVNGSIDAQGEDPDDRWRLNVANNEVVVQEGRVVFD